MCASKGSIEGSSHPTLNSAQMAVELVYSRFPKAGNMLNKPMMNLKIYRVGRQTGDPGQPM